MLIAAFHRRVNEFENSAKRILGPEVRTSLDQFPFLHSMRWIVALTRSLWTPSWPGTPEQPAFLEAAFKWLWVPGREVARAPVDVREALKVVLPQLLEIAGIGNAPPPWPASWGDEAKPFLGDLQLAALRVLCQLKSDAPNGLVPAVLDNLHRRPRGNG